jgi:hypothetical protein
MHQSVLMAALPHVPGEAAEAITVQPRVWPIGHAQHLKRPAAILLPRLMLPVPPPWVLALHAAPLQAPRAPCGRVGLS